MMIPSRLQLMSARAHAAASQPQARKLIFQTICQFPHPPCCLFLCQSHHITSTSCHNMRELSFLQEEKSRVNMSWISLAVKWAMRLAMQSSLETERKSHYSSFRPIIPMFFLLLEPLRPEIITRVFLICYKFAAPSNHTQNITRISQRSRRDQKLTIKYYILFFHVEKTT